MPTAEELLAHENELLTQRVADLEAQLAAAPFTAKRRTSKQSVVTAPEAGEISLSSPMEMAIRFLSELRDRTQDTDVVQGLDKALTLLQAFGGARSITPSRASSIDFTHEEGEVSPWHVDVQRELHRGMRDGNINVDDSTHKWLLSVLTSREQIDPTAVLHAASCGEIPPAPPSPVKALQALRSTVLDASFDVVQLDEESQGHCLSVLFPEILSRCGLLDGFQVWGFDPKVHGEAYSRAITQDAYLRLDHAKLLTFLNALESSYGDSAFHNRRHAADVVLNMYRYLSDSTKASPLHSFAALFAAVVHDFSHPGTTNAYEVKTDSELAVRYSDNAVLEAHHLARAFALLHEHKFLEGWTREAYAEFRRHAIRIVLMTDLSKHFDFISVLKTAPDDKELDEIVFMSAAIKAADLGHAAKSFEAHERWARLITEEFFALGDRERDSGLIISPLCNRELDANLPKNQVSFFEFICQPLFSSLARIMPSTFGADFKQLMANRATWKARAMAAEANGD